MGNGKVYKAVEAVLKKAQSLSHEKNTEKLKFHASTFSIKTLSAIKFRKHVIFSYEAKTNLKADHKVKFVARSCLEKPSGKGLGQYFNCSIALFMPFIGLFIVIYAQIDDHGERENRHFPSTKFPRKVCRIMKISHEKREREEQRSASGNLPIDCSLSCS